MDEIIKSRLRLWLRSERAMGLPSVGPIRLAKAAPATASPPRAPSRRQAVAAESPAPMPLAPPARSTEPFSSPVLSPEQKRSQLALIDQGEVVGCTKCPLCATRTRTVFGEGDADASLMFIGEGPGSREDQTGRPFVGPAGELLTRMINAMGLARERVYIANTVKCRAFLPGPPPKDRAPAPDEMAACTPYLERQVEIIRPRVIVTLGLPASQFVLQTKLSMSRMRGQWHSWRGIRVMPTWHPSYLLRREREGDVEPKRQAWADLQLVMGEMGLVAPRKGV